MKQVTGLSAAVEVPSEEGCVSGEVRSVCVPLSFARVQRLKQDRRFCPTAMPRDRRHASESECTRVRRTVGCVLLFPSSDDPPPIPPGGMSLRAA